MKQRTHAGAHDAEREAADLTGAPLLDWSPPRVVPAGWRALTELCDGMSYTDGKLTVIISGAREQDGRRWVHLSVSHKDRIPAWRELRRVKDLFLGQDAKAISVLPAEREYVNLHPYVLHLWHCLDGDGLPDFTRNTGSL